MNEAQSDFNNDKDLVAVVESEAQDAILGMLNNHELHVHNDEVPTNVSLVVEYS